MLTILLDMDEVLTDFVGAALREHGWTRRQLEKVWTPGTWSIVEPMEMTQEQFWKPIRAAGTDFWAHMGQTVWSDLMLDLVNKLGPWLIVTSPSVCAAAGTGKISWLQNKFGADFARYIITPCKTALARPDYILIDDREETVQAFTKAGGRGIVFPSRHNSLHLQSNNPLDYVYRRYVEESRHALSF
jgi:5'(3')-deoxyribonucleotidase